MTVILGSTSSEWLHRSVPLLALGLFGAVLWVSRRSVDASALSRNSRSRAAGYDLARWPCTVAGIAGLICLLIAGLASLY